jgi:hypothetical protein
MTPAERYGVRDWGFKVPHHDNFEQCEPCAYQLGDKRLDGIRLASIK